MEQSDNRIDRLRDGVLEAIRMAENEQWHHDPLGTVERDHYDSLVRTLKAYDDQAKKYQTGIDTRETHSIHLLVEHGIDPRVIRDIKLKTTILTSRFPCGAYIKIIVLRLRRRTTLPKVSMHIIIEQI